MQGKKDKKTLYLPNFVIDMLEIEAERAGGPGKIAGAAILAFVESSDEAKVASLKHFNDRELKEAYQLVEDVARKNLSKQKQSAAKRKK